MVSDQQREFTKSILAQGTNRLVEDWSGVAGKMRMGGEKLNE